MNRHAHQRSPASGSLENLSHGPCACVGEGARKPRVHRIDRAVCTDSCTTTTVHDAHQCGATQTHVLPRHRPPTVAFEPSVCMLRTTHRPISPLAVGTLATTAIHRITHEHFLRQYLPGPTDLRASDQPRRSHAAISTCLPSPLDPWRTFFAQCLLQDLSQDFCRTLHLGGNSAKSGCLAVDSLTHWSLGGEGVAVTSWALTDQKLIRHR